MGERVSALGVADASVLVVSATGAVVGDLNTRRSHIAGMSPEGGIATLEASMPQVEAHQYSTQLYATLRADLWTWGDPDGI